MNENRRQFEAAKEARRQAEAKKALEKAERAKAARDEENAANKKKLDEGEKNREKAERDYAEKIKKEREERRKEAERVRERIRRDKEARAAERAAAEERKKAVREGRVDPVAATVAGPSSSVSGKGDICALQVRLFDGSTIWSRFKATDTLAANVRKWIDEQSEVGEQPYTFKQILTPLPSRKFEVGEEGSSLRDLGLVPTATLVLVPVQGAASAYQSGGIIGSAVSGVTGLVRSGFGLVTGFWGGGDGQASQQDEAPSTAAVTDAASAAERRRRDGQNLYVGNGVSTIHAW
jgi:hypothetical protein